jgi:NADPH-dependent glutamate synthase beta subunit-like oxidoreductase
LYVTGWLKRGPSGVILTNVGDAAETVAALLEDRRSRASHHDGGAGAGGEGYGGRGGGGGSDAEIGEILDGHGGQVVGFEAARRVAEAEARRGAAAGKVREKFVSVRELLDAARG